MSSAAPDEGIAERVAAVHERIARAAQRAGRDPASIRLVGVSKRQTPQRVAAAVRAGVTWIGENYVQEMAEKRPRVDALLSNWRGPSPSWRMVGRLQRNKARLAVSLFDAIESLDREELARELDRRAAQAGRRLELLIQVNLSDERQKGGTAPEDVGALLRACVPLTQLRVSGLMTVPAAAEDPEASRCVFARLRELRDTLQHEAWGKDLMQLSMGMSADLDVAIEEGATIVRVGTALFGPRESSA